jgi:hypothetical protein
MRSILALTALLAVPFLGSATDPTAPDPVNMAGIRQSEARDFLNQLQDALRRDDRKAVAGMVSFPVLVHGSEIADADTFLGDYERIMTPALRELVLGFAPEDLWANYSGVMIGNGAVWFAGICRDADCSAHDVRIITINGVTPTEED